MPGEGLSSYQQGCGLLVIPVVFLAWLKRSDHFPELEKASDPLLAVCRQRFSRLLRWLVAREQP